MNQNPLGLSTSWNAAGIKDGRHLVDKARSLGFRGIEVEYRVSATAVAGIEEAVRAGDIRILSVHNYSPLLAGEKASTRGGDKRNLASLDRAQASEAIELSKRSIDLAERLGAGVLVVHAGETDMGREYFGEIADLVRAEGVRSDAAVGLRADLKKQRDKAKAPYLEAMLQSLKQLAGYGAQHGVRLGIENRYYYHQVPLPEEIEWLLGELDSPQAGYWHDVGHAHVMEALGFSSHLECLDRLKPSLIGMHLHDSVFIKDHRAPGTGEIDFPAVIERTSASTIKIMELAPFVTGEEIRGALAYLESIGVNVA